MKSSLLENTLLVETTERIEGVRVGKVANVDETGRVWVEFPENGKEPVAARFTRSVKLQALHQAAIAGQEVLIVFENNDPKQPIILDMMYSLLDEVASPFTLALAAEKPEDVTVDGKKITFEAKDEIVLRCGKASIILTKAGKILIRGEYLLNHSSGVNRIKGGSVQIN